MEDIKDVIDETLGAFNVVIVETGKDVEEFAVEKMKDFKEAVIETEARLVKSVETSASLEVGEIFGLAGFKLEEMKETEMEEMVEEVKPRLRRETFENSLMLSRVGGRQFLLVLLVMAQVMAQIITIRETVDDGAFDAKNADADALCLVDCDLAYAWPALLPGRCPSSSITKACSCACRPWDGLAQVDHPPYHPPHHPP